MYVIVLDSALRDIFDQALGPIAGRTITTTGYVPSVDYPVGRLLVERAAYRTLTASYMNVGALVAATTPIPDSLLPLVLARSWGHDELIRELGGTRLDTVSVPRQNDRPGLAAIRLPIWNAQRPGSPALVAVQVDTSAGTVRRSPVPCRSLPRSGTTGGYCATVSFSAGT